MPYPHGADCKCPALPADAGLLAFTVDCEHHAELSEALRRLERYNMSPVKIADVLDTRGNVVATLERACDGSFTCSCKACEREKAARVRQGVRRVRQPWELAA